MIWYDMMWCDVMWCDVMWCDVLCCVVLCCVVLCCVMLCYVMLCYVMLCYVMLCYVMLLCYVVMLCYVMLSFTVVINKHISVTINLPAARYTEQLTGCLTLACCLPYQLCTFSVQGHTWASFAVKLLFRAVQLSWGQMLQLTDRVWLV